MATIHCKLCDHPLPEGKEHPPYFGQVSIGWEPGDEDAWTAEDIGQLLRYADTISEAMQDMLSLATLTDTPACASEIMDKQEYLERARSLCLLLTELTGEVERKADVLAAHLYTRATEKEVARQAAAGKEG